MRVTFRCDPALIDNLERPIPARQVLPKWLRNMPGTDWSALHGESIRTVKHCPPFIDAMAYGFIMPLPCDVRMHDGVLSWDWDLPQLTADAHPRSPISFHVPAQVTATPFYNPGISIVKFNSFWTIELEAGYSLFATHPANRADLPFRLLTGLVDCDRFFDVGVLFPAVWIDPDFEGVLPRGTPVAQCFPVARTTLELHCEALSAAAARRYDETAAALLSRRGLYRRKFRARRGRSTGE
ncbi:MAG TPA: hypothetical protein VMU69_27975 [Bradyrhizobium sp.]|nr:hypothetical protein [Bradyrhizobium sp.]